MTIHCEQHKLDTIDVALKEKLPILLVGETGVGKTTIVSEIAKKRGYTLVRLSLNDQVGREDLIGKFGLEGGSTKWIDGPVLDAMRKGYWVVLDELNSARPEVLFALHGLLDDERSIVLQEKDNEKVKAHNAFKLFATINPVSYHGTKNLNQAFTSRFVIIDINVLPPEKEVELLKEKCKIADVGYDTLIAFAHALRKLKSEGQIEYFCSTRDLIIVGQLIEREIPIEHAITYGILNKMSSDDMDYLGSNSPVVEKIIAERTKGARSITKDMQEYEKLKGEADARVRAIQEADVRLKSMDAETKSKQSTVSVLVADINKKQGELKSLQEAIDLTRKLGEDERIAIAKEYLKKIL